VGACVAALVLIFYAIPGWVSSPSNVRNIVLSPTFWPYTLAGFTGLIGLGLLLAARGASSEPDADAEEPAADGLSWVRLGALGVIMVATMFALPRIGMVWTCMIVFAVTALLLFRTRHPRTALVCAVVIPLALYLFFAKVAGVAIPQGVFVRLP
jgi:hypothetical protein